MRVFLACMFALIVTGCGPGAAHEFPPAEHARFSASCPPSEPVCVCTWDAITHKMSYEEYQAALARFRSEGLMDTRITHARTQCVERNPHHA